MLKMSLGAGVIPKGNCISYRSGAHSYYWPGWTSEQKSAVKYLNSFMWPVRTQFKPSKYLHHNDFIHVISFSASCSSWAVLQVLHLWAQKNVSRKINLLPLVCCLGFFLFFLMKHICVSSIVKQLPNDHLLSKASENRRWLPANKMNVFHHGHHKFFSNLDDCSCSHAYKISSGVWNAVLKRYNRYV